MAGFAFGLVAAALWLHVLTPTQSAALIVVYGLIVQGHAAWKLRRAIKWRRLAPLIVGALVGVPLGVLLLRALPASTLRIGIGIFLIAFSLYSLLKPRMPQLSGDRPWRTAESAC